MFDTATAKHLTMDKTIEHQKKLKKKNQKDMVKMASNIAKQGNKANKN